MGSIPNFLNRRAHLFGKWDFYIFTLLTVLSLLNGQTTVFYLIYLFWWNELLNLCTDKFLYKKNPNALYEHGLQGSFIGPLFMMGIYFVFIIVFFGFIASWSNKDITLINMNILFFRNWFFNINLLFILSERIYLHRSQQAISVNMGHFTPNMIVLHLSIVLGGLMMFFIVKNHPDTFTPDNLWGSVIIILPFLLLKALIVRLTQSVK